MTNRLAKFIGRPYEKCNCFDLVKDFYSEFFNLDLRQYYQGEGIPSKQDRESLIVSNLGSFEKVDKPIFGDLVIINLYGYSCHIGVLVHDNLLLHTIRNVGSCIEPVSKYRRMLEGYYRHKVREE